MDSSIIWKRNEDESVVTNVAGCRIVIVPCEWADNPTGRCVPIGWRVQVRYRRWYCSRSGYCSEEEAIRMAVRMARKIATKK